MLVVRVTFDATSKGVSTSQASVREMCRNTVDLSITWHHQVNARGWFSALFVSCAHDTQRHDIWSDR